MVPSLCRLATIVFSLLTGRGPSCRDDPDAVAALGINHRHKNVVNHSRNNVPDLARVAVNITTLTGKHITEHKSRRLEADAMFYQVALGFVGVPFELFHMVRP